MRVGALRPYEHSIATAHDPVELELCTSGGTIVRLDLARWLGAADRADCSALAHCADATIDIGCGPGRLLAELSRRGVAALGVDIAPTAVRLSLRRGAVAMVRDVFIRVPAEGRWATALLVDGNIGIGGDPLRLLRRVREIVRPDGELIVETDPRAGVEEVLDVRFRRDGVVVGPAFRWARAGADAVAQRAAGAGWATLGRWSVDGRCFVRLGPAASERVA